MSRLPRRAAVVYSSPIASLNACEFDSSVRTGGRSAYFGGFFTSALGSSFMDGPSGESKDSPEPVPGLSTRLVPSTPLTGGVRHVVARTGVNAMSMLAYYSYTQSELEALAELPPECAVLYLLHLHPLANFKTGALPELSLGVLAANMGYLPPAGSHKPALVYTRKQIRRVLDLLQSAGLIARDTIANKLNRCLKIRLTHLPIASARPREEGQSSELARSQPQTQTNRRIAPHTHSSKGSDEGHIISTSVLKAAAIPTEIVDNSTSATPLLENHFETIKTTITELEAARGKTVRIPANDKTVQQWIAQGIDRIDLAQAHQMAVADRIKRDDPSAINVGFLNVFVTRLKTTPQTAHTARTALSGDKPFYVPPQATHSTPQVRQNQLAAMKAALHIGART